MVRSQVIQLLGTQVIGRELFEVATHYGVTVETERGVNKGWAGQTLEHAVHLSNSNQATPDGEDFELKSTRVEFESGLWVPKETIKVTNLSPEKILTEDFLTSTFWRKLSRMIIVGCEYKAPNRAKAVLVAAVDVTSPALVSEIRATWEDIRHLTASGELPDHHDIGTYKDLIQLRPTGSGKQLSTCPVTGEKFPSRAFYATKRFLHEVLNNL